MKRPSLLVLLAFAVGCSSSPAPEAVSAASPSRPSLPAPAPAAERRSLSSTDLYVTASGLNVRAEPSTSAAIVAKVSRGDVLQSTGSDRDWTFVRTGSGVTGWVSTQHVSREKPVAIASSSRRSARPNGPCGEIRFAKSPVPSFSDASAHGLIVIEAKVNAEGDVVSTRVVSNSTDDIALAARTEREIRAARFEPLGRSCSAREFLYTYKRSF